MCMLRVHVCVRLCAVACVDVHARARVPGVVNARRI